MNVSDSESQKLLTEDKTMENKNVKLYAPIVETIWGALVVVGFCSYIFFV